MNNKAYIETGVQNHNIEDRLKNRFGNYSIFPALLLQDKGLSHFNPKDEHTIHPVSFFR